MNDQNFNQDFSESIPLGVDPDELRRIIAETAIDVSDDPEDGLDPYEEESAMMFGDFFNREEVGIDEPTFMQNRELSWLSFNERVLDQGADDSVPLLERLNFISIFSSNLQEFFMVRVGSLTDLSLIDPPIIDSKTGMTAKQQLRAIHERCHELYPIQESTYEHVRGLLAQQGVRHLRPGDLSDEQRNYLYGMVKHNVEPFLSPQIINSRHPFPHLENGKLYILVRLDDAAAAAERKKKKAKGGKKGKGGADGVVLGLIPLPHQCDRVIKLPGRGFQFILLEHAIEMFVPEIFDMYKIKHTNVICVTRNADLDARQGGDELDEDYREHMKRLLRKRSRLAPVRLECERPLSPVMETLMLKKLGLKRHQVYDTAVPLDLSFTWGLGGYLSAAKSQALSNVPFMPAWPTCFDRTRPLIPQVCARDTLLFYPYESMDPFVQLLREAAADPAVASIKITLYRLASQSHLAEALIAAAEAGKEVTALFELRARFDESNNIEWSQRFEEAGCNVIYGFRDYKVHSKICCITRRGENGALQHITQLGTGNYNEKTARLYTDLSFITTDPIIGRDAMEFFRNMQLENISDDYERLSVAPLQIKAMILRELDRQAARARAGKPAGVFFKTNSITDKEVIEKIAEASQAGVPITLFVRGICCLLPHVKGSTDNVRVVSLVGRLLEHSRIYCFGTSEDCTIYLSSADLMTRNLNKRIEIAWPLLDSSIKRRVLTYISICMHDTAKLRELRPNGTYTPLGAFCELDVEGNPEPAYNSQEALIHQAQIAANEGSQRPSPAETVQGQRDAAVTDMKDKLKPHSPAVATPAHQEDASLGASLASEGFDAAEQAEINPEVEIKPSTMASLLPADKEMAPASISEEGEAPVTSPAPTDKKVADEPSIDSCDDTVVIPRIVSDGGADVAVDESLAPDQEKSDVTEITLTQKDIETVVPLVPGGIGLKNDDSISLAMLVKEEQKLETEAAAETEKTTDNEGEGEANQRVSALRERLSTAPEQKVDPALDSLTDMRIGEILPGEGTGDENVELMLDADSIDNEEEAAKDEAVSDFFADNKQTIEMPPDRRRHLFGRNKK